MCGIAGFSLTAGSKIKSRQLSNAMLTAIEDRGYMASGYGWQHNGNQGYHSAATPGSALSLKFLPRRANTVILHTRLATHGSVEDNRNNHPVTSPSKGIALIHNGVIYNHEDVRPEITGSLPDVDTSVIPALIEQQGIKSISKLDGDAAIAWLDKRQQGTLHLARYQHSPLVICQLEDGSFAFASTEELLWRVLVQLDLTPTFMHTPDELTYYTVKLGVIQSQEPLPEPAFVSSKYNYGYYRHQTSGAKGTEQPTATDNPYGYHWYDDVYDESWDYDYMDLEPLPKHVENRYYWAEIRGNIMGNPQNAELIWYDKDEREIWLNELYSMPETNGVELMDYGILSPEGVMESQQDAIF